MTQMFAAVAVLTGVFVSLQPAHANQAPWCAVIELSKGSALLGLPVQLVRRLLPQRQYFGGQSSLLQSQSVLRP